MDQLTVEELREAFDIHDSNEDGILTKDEFITLTSSMGKGSLDPNLSPFSKVVGQLSEREQPFTQSVRGIELAEEKEFFTFDDFRSVVESGTHFDITSDEVTEAFKIFSTYQDDDGGMVDISEFLHKMENFGEVLSYDETQEVVRDVTTDNKINVGNIAKIADGEGKK